MGDPKVSPEISAHCPFQDTDGHDSVEAEWSEGVLVLRVCVESKVQGRTEQGSEYLVCSLQCCGPPCQG